jgi:RimJ/RimL family protein N-acetyltransferase
MAADRLLMHYPHSETPFPSRQGNGAQGTVPSSITRRQLSSDAIRIREAAVDDAGALLALKRSLDRETSFMLLEPDERTTTEADVAEQLHSVAARPNSVVIVADAAGELVGYVEAIGGGVRRNRHTVHVVIGVRQSHAERGLGRRLLAELESWARASDIRRLELTVMTHNERALGLYRKMGYQVEGTRRGALFVDGELVDELWMAKLLA